jgi:hypothetical protein
MKKSELTQLTQIIEHLVAREVRKQLPTVISEVFQNMMGNKPVITEKKEPEERAPIREQQEPDEFKASLKELFAGVTPTGVHVPEPNVDKPAPRQARQYTKNPVLNQILNETTGDLRQREGMVGAAAFQGGYSPMPTMAPPVMMEGQDSVRVGEGASPLSTLPQGVSALDIARQVPLAAPVAQALTKNYSQMMKLIDKKKKGAVA